MLTSFHGLWASGTLSAQTLKAHATHCANKPSNKFVASFIGSPPMNFMDVQVVRRGSHVWLDEGKLSLQLLPSMESAVTPYVGGSVILGVRPEDIYDKLYAVNGGTIKAANISLAPETPAPLPKPSPHPVDSTRGRRVSPTTPR